MSTTDPNKPKRKKASGWAKWKAKKKAAAAAAAGLPTPVVSVPASVVGAYTDPGVAIGVTGVTGLTGLPVTALKNHYAIILDRSGSMENIRQPTVNAFNEQVGTVRTASRGQQTDVTLVTFSTTVDAPTHLAAPVDSLKELTYNEYRPDGWTALYDAILATTDHLSKLPDANDPTTSFLVCIITDGEENRSLHSAREVADRIQALQATKRWTFTFAGANVNLDRITKLGLSSGNTRSYTATAAGVRGMSQLHSTATQSFFSARSAGATQSLDLYKKAEEMLKKQQEEEAKKAASTPTT